MITNDASGSEDTQPSTQPQALLAVERPSPESAMDPPTSAVGKDLVTITVAVPRNVRRTMKVACAVNNVTLQNATAEAFWMWLAMKNVTLE